MTITKTVELTCDECVNLGNPIYGATVAEVKAQAREEGWTLNQHGHFCHCNERGWRGRYYRGEEGESYGERIRAAADQLLRERTMT